MIINKLVVALYLVFDLIKFIKQEVGLNKLSKETLDWSKNMSLRTLKFFDWLFNLFFCCIKLHLRTVIWRVVFVAAYNIYWAPKVIQCNQISWLHMKALLVLILYLVSLVVFDAEGKSIWNNSTSQDHLYISN